MQRLPRAILHRRDSEQTQFSIPFWNEGALERLRFVLFCGEFDNGLRLLLRRVELSSIHAGSAPTRVFRHSSNSETARAVGASEDDLQGADFALLALLLRLYDSPLQTTHVAIGLFPIDGMPVHGLTQARASNHTWSGFRFSTNSCSLRRRHNVSYRKTSRKSARFLAP